MPEAQAYGFDKSGVSRIVKTVKWAEANGTRFDATPNANPNAGPQCVFAKLTGKSGTAYAWTQAKPSSVSGWGTVTGGLTGTTSARPALFLDSSDIDSDLTNKYVVLVRGTMGSSNDPCWVIACVCGGYTGTKTVYGAVTVSGTNTLVQAHEDWHFRDGRLVKIDNAGSATVDAGEACP